MSETDAIFLVNPASANGATAKRWPKLRARAAELGLEGDELLSERPGHLTELARDAAADGRLLVVVGGDGTLNEVVERVVGTEAEIAVLPERDRPGLRPHLRDPDEVRRRRRVALTGEARAIDLGRAVFRGLDGEEATRIFANVGSVGMSGAVARRANGMSKALGGRATFYYALVREFVALEEHRGDGRLRRRASAAGRCTT